MSYTAKRWSDISKFTEKDLNELELAMQEAHISLSKLNNNVSYLHTSSLSLTKQLNNLISNTSSTFNYIKDIEELLKSNTSLADAIKLNSEQVLLKQSQQLSNSEQSQVLKNLGLNKYKFFEKVFVNGLEVSDDTLNLDIPVIDSSLNDLSLNAINNKAVTEEFNKIHKNLKKLNSIDFNSIIDSHNQNNEAHQDIRALINNIQIPDVSGFVTHEQMENAIDAIPEIDTTLFASKNHNHDDKYSFLNHNHNDVYSPLTHNHDSVYSKLTHNHDDIYSKLTHDHDDAYSKIGHTHDYSKIFSDIDHTHAGMATETFVNNKVSNLASKATTLAGYGITDAKINNGTITLGSNTIKPLTSFTESDPTVPAWAKAETKPTYKWDEITNKPSFFSGNYDDLNNKPTLFSGKYADLTGKPTLFSGSYNDLTNKPTLFSGDYNDLLNKPTIPTIPSLAKVATSGSYTDLADKPTIPSGAAASKNVDTSIAAGSTSTNLPTSKAVAAFVEGKGYLTGFTETDPTVPTWAKAASKPTYTWSEITSKPTFATVATSGSYNDLSNKPTIPTLPTLATVATSGSYNDLTNKPTIPTVPSFGAKGSTTKPVYLSAANTFSEASTYAGGTALTLNGSSKSGSTASIYAPTSYGSSGAVLVSNGSGSAPTWSTTFNAYSASFTASAYNGTLIAPNNFSIGSNQVSTSTGSGTTTITFCSGTEQNYYHRVYFMLSVYDADTNYAWIYSDLCDSSATYTTTTYRGMATSTNARSNSCYGCIAARRYIYIKKNSAFSDCIFAIIGMERF